MKTKLWNWTITLIFLLIAATNYAQGWELPYLNITTDTGYEAHQVLPADSGGFHVLVSRPSISASGNDFYIMEIDPNGNTIDLVTLGIGETHVTKHMIAAANGDLVLVSQQSISGDSQITFWRLDEDYNILQQNTFGTTEHNEKPRGIFETPNGDFWVTGLGAAWPLTSFLQKIDAQGQTIGDPIYEFSEQCYVTRIFARPGGGARVLGYGKINGVGSAQILIHEFDDNGQFLNLLTFTTPTGELIARDVTKTSDGGFVLVARHTTGTGPLMIKADADGNETWRNTYNPLGSFLLTGIVEKVDNSGYKVMFSETFFGSTPHCGLIETDLSGNWIWEKRYAVNYFNEAHNILPLADNGAIIVGDRNLIPNINNSYNVLPYIIRTDANGNTFESAVSGSVGKDDTDDCVTDGIDQIPGQTVTVFQNGFAMFTAEVDALGDYLLPALQGNYKLAVNLPNFIWNSCQDSIDIVVPAADTLEDQDFVISYDNEPLISVSGYLFEDFDHDCMQDSFETTGYEGWTVYLNLYEDNLNSTFVETTDSNGFYSFTNLLPFTTGAEGLIYFEAPIGTGLNCGFPCWQEALIGPFMGPSVQFNNGVNCDTLPFCPIMSVAIATNEIRPCLGREYSINYCNIGGETAINAYVEVTIDSALTVTGSNPAWDSQLDNVYTFQVGNLLSNECGDIDIAFTAPCDDPMGTTYCSEAYAYPDSTCVAPSPLWDGSEIQLSAACESDSVIFTIKNTGVGDMSQQHNYIVIEDNVLRTNGSETFQLNAGDETNVGYIASGSFFRMTSEQSPGFPGFSTPTSWIEGCGDSGPISLGMVNQYPLGDEDTWEDIFCIASTNSYDPNDKTGFPLGLTSAHYIDQNVEMDYIIRFQNEGTADALQVEIRDTLPTEYLNPTTIRVGASSHNYTWDIEGNGIVVFTFENINLPPESVDVEASKGFIQLKVNQFTDLPIGTQIENSAAIYFDNNEPVITNLTLHTIGSCLIPSTIPTVPGIYHANNECTDDNNWTHYFDNVDGIDGNGNDLLLLSIKKEGNDIGSVGDGTFDLFVEVGHNNNGEAIHIPNTVPYVTSEVGWHIMDRYWSVAPTSQPPSPLNVKYYYSEDDYIAISNAPDVTLNGHESLVFFKTIENADPNPANGHVGIVSDEILLFNFEGTDWLYTGPGKNHYHSAELLEVTSFSGGGGGASDCDGCGPLPVELISFTGKSIEKKALLEWSTSSEVNNDFFIVERSVDGIQFTQLAKVSSKGSSSKIQKYEYMDKSPMQGLNYYRLSQTDLDGSTQTIDKRVVLSFEQSGNIKLYPTPVNRNLFVEFKELQSSERFYRVFDGLGRLIRDGSFNSEVHNNTYRIDVKDLPKGIYYLAIGKNETDRGLRFMKE